MLLDMSVAEIKKTKSELIAWIEKLSDVNMLQFLSGLKRVDKNNDWWNELTEAQQLHIMEGVKQVENGQTVSATEFWQQLKNG